MSMNNMDFKRKLPIPMEVKEKYPIPFEVTEYKEKFDREVADVFTGKSDKFVLVIGPCSADREDAVMEYIYHLKDVQQQVKDKLIIIPRIYTNKPRTTGDGYKGMLHQPDPTHKPDMYKGIVEIRHLHSRALDRKSAASPDRERTVCPCRLQKPDKRRYCSDDEFYHRRTAPAYLYLPRLGGRECRQSLSACDFKGLCRCLRQADAQLSL